MVSVAVVNEVLERRRRQRWSVLAQYVMFELVRNARMIWTGSSTWPACGRPTRPGKSAELGAEIVRDTSRLTEAVRDILRDDVAAVACIATSPRSPKRQTKCSAVGPRSCSMPSCTPMSSIVTSNSAGDLAWIGSLLDARLPATSPAPRRPEEGAASAAVKIEPGAAAIGLPTGSW